jgi:exopolysaccharide biosynthesis predicted pyruvyltransferase EpsI
MDRTPLESLLLDRQPETLLLIPPPGNHGDTLIHTGLRKRLDELGIPYTRFGRELGVDAVDVVGDVTLTGADYTNGRTLARLALAAPIWVRYKLLGDFDTIYIHGGGSFNDLWGGAVQAFRTATAMFDTDVIVGPHSCLFEDSDPAALFRGVSNDVFLFCRERYSYDAMTDALADCSTVCVHLSPDTALYLDRSDLLAGGGTEDYTLLAFRSDQESVGSHATPDVEGATTIEEDISDTRDSLAGFVEAVARARRVYTDRLHVATLAVILEKPVTFYGNAYHKNRGVYEYSLSGYDRIEFVDPSAETADP